MYHRFFKRIVDLVLSLIILLMISPLLILVSILIKIESSGPVFFVQERLGLHKKVFKVLKFRTMTHKDRNIHIQVYKDNPEITKIGAFLRRFKIDELPQFINVLTGEMSIVGPRPCLPSLTHKFDENTPFRFRTKPGVTSLAGVRGSIYLSWGQKWLYDRIYAERVSFWLDMRIIFETILVVIFGEERFLKEPTNDTLSKN